MNGRTRICGIIGDPVEHSISPMLHHFLAERTGTDLAYAPFRVKAEAVEEAVKGAYALNLLGLNVTVPHKQRVMEYLDGIDREAMAIGAVNTLVRTEKGYKGYNTDGAGFRRALAESGIRIQGERCILLGAGGAAKAAACELAWEGAGEIFILNRNRERACELADHVNGQAGRQAVVGKGLEDWKEIPAIEKGYLAVQSTSVGMDPHGDQVILEDPAFYRLLHTAVDIVYTPSCTRFMELAREAGARAVNGLDMLLYQGIIAYELWNPGVKVDPLTASEARQMLERHLSGGHNVILTGFMGAGKTSVGKYAAKHWGLPFIDTDQEIERETGMAISDLFAKEGEEAFRQMETETLRRLVGKKVHAVISVGGGLPLREENRALLKQLGQTVYLDVSPDTVMERIGGDVSDRPMLQGENVRERITGLLTLRKPLYLKAADHSVSVDGRTIEEICGEIRRNIGL